VQRVVSNSVNTKSVLPKPTPSTNARRRAPFWPWMWLALTGVATVGWLVAIAWAATALSQWFLD
jgi:hypothetical protein